METPDADSLARVALFAELDELQRQVVAGWLEASDVGAGRALTHQGASGYAFFILRDGEADVVIDGSVVRTLRPGDFFGELAILGSGRQTATVVAKTDVQVWVMFGTRFRELQLQHPRIAATIEATAAERTAAG